MEYLHTNIYGLIRAWVDLSRDISAVENSLKKTHFVGPNLLPCIRGILGPVSPLHLHVRILDPLVVHALEILVFHVPRLRPVLWSLPDSGLCAGRPDRDPLLPPGQSGGLADHPARVHCPDAGPVVGGPEHLFGLLWSRGHPGVRLMHHGEVVLVVVPGIRQIVRVFRLAGPFHEQSRAANERIHGCW